MKVIGLTGGIASGKSTVARLLAARGVPVLDLDRVAREVVEPGQPALAEIAARWPGVVGPGGLDRKALGAIVVSDTGARRELEAITHPRIWERMEDWLRDREAEGSPAAVVEAALMVETGSYRRYDALLVVACSPEIQRARLAGRDGYDPETVDRWLKAQMPVDQKVALADAVIWNDGDEAALRAALDEAWGRLV